MKGIMFKEDMHWAVVESLKTQTRRLSGLDYVNQNPDQNKFLRLKKDPEVCCIDKQELKNEPSKLKGIYAEFYIDNSEYERQLFRPRYQPGDIVYLKEPYFITKGIVTYCYFNDDANVYPKKYWKNKLFMPARYARHFIKIESVEVERILDISEENARAEGISIQNKYYVNDFLAKWCEINGSISIVNHPWIWAYKFKYLEYIHNLEEAEHYLQNRSKQEVES